jgi:hypothetical protein
LLQLLASLGHELDNRPNFFLYAEMLGARSICASQMSRLTLFLPAETKTPSKSESKGDSKRKVASFAHVSLLISLFPQPLPKEHYTVAIVCALPIELAAVLVVLDGGEHPARPLDEGDANQYAFAASASTTSSWRACPTEFTDMPARRLSAAVLSAHPQRGPGRHCQRACGSFVCCRC